MRLATRGGGRVRISLTHANTINNMRNQLIARSPIFIWGVRRAEEQQQQQQSGTGRDEPEEQQQEQEQQQQQQH